LASAVQAVQAEHRYPSGRTGLRPLDLDIGAGEVVVVLGPNGSGKSTLLRLVATDLRLRGGSLVLIGRPLGPPLRRHRRHIGYAPDTPVHLPWLTGRENARFFLELKGVWNEGARARVEFLLTSFGLAEVADVPVSEYSFGMERKLLLVEALAPPHPILLLDEPSVGLDPDGSAALRDAVRERAREGAAVLISTNDTREVPRWADRIVFLHRGMLVEDAPLPTLLARLEGKTRIDLTFARWTSDPPAELRGDPPLPGLTALTWTGEGAHLESAAGAEPLPELLRILLASGIAVLNVRVREPDLGDLFRSITGVTLSPVAGSEVAIARAAAGRDATVDARE
jgi:ABC-2 type transport system ATP-binding protein